VSEDTLIFDAKEIPALADLRLYFAFGFPLGPFGYPFNPFGYAQSKLLFAQGYGYFRASFCSLKASANSEIEAALHSE
jgi:hypothetical protein